MFAGRHVELPAVPRTRDLTAGDSSFSQRPAGMRTDSIQHVELAFDIEERDHSARRDHFDSLTGFDVVNGGNSNLLSRGNGLVQK